MGNQLKKAVTKARTTNYWRGKENNDQRSFVGSIFMGVGHDNDTGNRNNRSKKKEPTGKSIIGIL